MKHIYITNAMYHVLQKRDADRCCLYCWLVAILIVAAACR